MREFLNRLVDWFRRDKLERELADEIQFHRGQLERDARGSGVAPDEVPYAARRQLGSVTRVIENARERWSLPAMEQLLQDVRYALRGFRRSPGFTSTVVVTLALGVGANTAMFGVVDRLMFRPFAFMKDPARVHRVYLRATFRGNTNWGYGGEYTRYVDFKTFTTSFSDFAVFSDLTMATGDGESARERRVEAVSASFFDFFNAAPVRGRFFGKAEDSLPRGAEVSVLGYAFWQAEFGGRDVIGQHLQVGQITTTIIGIAPEGFAGVSDLSPPAVYIPATLYAGSVPNSRLRDNYYKAYSWSWSQMMVRRRPGVTIVQANADITQAFRRSWEAERAMDPTNPPVDEARPSGVVSSLRVSAGPDPSLEARTSVWLIGVAAIVLLIACANVANLFLARALRRHREIAVRMALGVSRGRLMRQTLIESLLLSLVGSAAGLVVARWGGVAIRRLLITTQNASLEDVTDWRTIGLVVGVALATGVLTGLAPAMLSARGDLTGALKAGAREGTYQRSRVRAGLLVAQGALSVVLLVGAGLFVRSLGNVNAIRLGYDADPVLMVEYNTRGIVLDTTQNRVLQEAILDRARATPGVDAAALAMSLPLAGMWSTGLQVAGIDSVRSLGRFTFQATTPDYFKVMGTQLLRGRGITGDDQAASPKVAVISQSMANVLWPGKDAIGQCMKVGGADTAPCTTVVGIAENVVHEATQLGDEKRFHYYLPITQLARRTVNYVIVRVHGDAATQAEQVRQSLQTAMPGAGYVKVRPMKQLVDNARRSWKLGATLFMAFGFLALVVAGVGLYGVVAYNVTQRMHELGVRVALGARRPDILRLVVGQSARFALAGVVVGSGVALLASRWIEPLLFRESGKDPVIYGAVAFVMMLAALLAAASPAIRAAGADPNSALRSD
jgi:putative ABC transport system permease protein